MLIRFPADIPPSQITPRAQFDRRRFLAASGGFAAALAFPHAAGAAAGTRLTGVRKGAVRVDEPLTPYATVTGYNNFYEFGPDKGDPAKHAGALSTRPWTVRVDGEVRAERVWDIDTLMSWAPLEERIYRFRCVEGWSMVVPWIGFPLAELIRRAEPTGAARYVAFVSLSDPAQMPYVRLPTLDWPYQEGLRLDEAMHPLALLAFGLYDEVLPGQNGAPLRLVVPWKYGFKSAKSLVAIRFLRDAPRTSWMKASPREYGFYANVNPDVPHPRWSQARERRLGEIRKRPTLPFNGYAEQVAGLYAGMDLRTHF